MLRIHPKSGLRKVGWYRSCRVAKPIDSDGSPLPWWTYPAIAFLRDRIRPQFRVLEFGAGYSTLWLCRRVQQVVSFENSPEWLRALQPQVGKNVTLLPAVGDFSELCARPPESAYSTS